MSPVHRFYGSSVWGVAARPSRTPRWKLAMRVLTTSGDLVGASASASPPPPPTEPGTRLALGTRLGSPAWVVSPADGAASARAARQPSSAGEVHDWPAASPTGAPGAGRAVLRLLPLRRNQSDSSESKIGSRWSWVAGGGTVTVPESVAPSVTWPPIALGPSPPRTSRLPIGGILGACGGTCPPNAGSLLGPDPKPSRPPELPWPADAAGVRGAISSASAELFAGAPLPLDLPRTGSDCPESASQPFPAVGFGPVPSGPASGPAPGQASCPAS